LLDYDCVSFNRFLETILSANTINQVTGQARVNQSPWLLTTAASTIFAVARDRVYIQHKIDKPALPKGKDLSSSVTIEEGEDEIDPAEAEAESVFDAMMAAATEESRINAPISEEQMIELERKAEEAEKRRGLPPGAEPILEEQPKWALLAAVLDEIENELHWAPVDLSESRYFLEASCISSSSHSWA
jgi:DNA excision repair protein ERCC-4